MEINSPSSFYAQGLRAIRNTYSSSTQVGNGVCKLEIDGIPYADEMGRQSHFGAWQETVQGPGSSTNRPGQCPFGTDRSDQEPFQRDDIEEIDNSLQEESQSKVNRKNVKPFLSPWPRRSPLPSAKTPPLFKAETRRSSAPERPRPRAYSDDPTSQPIPKIVEFEPRQSRRTVVEITNDVFKIMNQDFEKNNADEGRIYIVRSHDHPGLFKIGRTSRSINKRRDEISRCIGPKLDTVNDANHSCVPNVQRCEKLIHTELANYERKFCCGCKQKQRDCEHLDKLTKHGEWFEISEAKAVEVVERWRKWISKNPYCDGALREKEWLLIKRHRDDQALMNSLISEDGEYWCWHAFMQTSMCYYEYLWLKNRLFSKRPGKQSDRSRWESLLKHWKSNIIFCLLILMVLIVSSAIVSIFGFSSSAYVLMDTIILGIGGILYAA